MFTFHNFLLNACLVVVLGSSFAWSELQERGTSFDFYLFVLQWDTQVSSAFTIHGLWPENRDGSYPEFCSSNAYSNSAVSNLIPTMNVVWPSADGDNSAFWQHEWDKHGTCSSLAIQTYFTRTINLHRQYNIKNSGVAPGRSSRYTKSTLTQAIKAGLGRTPGLRCVNSALSEVALCVDKASFALINCPASLGSYFTCPTQITFV